METAAPYVLAVGIAVYLFAFVVYNAKMFSGKALPNVATWGLWAYLATINALTYLVITHSAFASAQQIGGAVSNIVTFGLALKYGKFSAMTKLDRAILAIGLLAGPVWAIGGKAIWANILVQICIFISIVPTWQSVYRRPGGEAALPWLMFGVAYGIQIVGLVLLHKNPDAFIAPANAGILQLAVGLLALRRPRTGDNSP